jgi:hypothetical protein
VSTFAGSGAAGWVDASAPLSAEFSGPTSLSFLPNGNLLVADYIGCRLRRVAHFDAANFRSLFRLEFKASIQTSRRLIAALARLALDPPRTPGMHGRSRRESRRGRALLSRLQAQQSAVPESVAATTAAV